MVKEYIKSTIDGIKERASNPFSENNKTPFAGAFLIAIIIYNWKLAFSLISFDSTSTRLQKIDIINSYLVDKNWTERIFIPLVIAFASIVFYYIFNNISLGLTTFFTRWFKSTILFYTDRSKLITRDEYEETISKMNITRHLYEALKKTFAESQTDLEEYKKNLRNKDAEIVGLKLNYERADQEVKSKNKIIETITEEKNITKILSARYGSGKIYKDVTEKVVDLLNSHKSFTANNKNLGGDPVANSPKILVIAYQYRGKVLIIVKEEGEKIEFQF